MPRVFAYQNVISEVLKSSSGGAFIALCKAFEQCHGKGNVVFVGAALQDDMKVRHVAVQNANQCDVFQGAKYVESQCDDLFSRVLHELANKKWVLFSGTPCQIYRLRSFLLKNQMQMDQIIFIDLICHVTPGEEIWNDYKSWLEEKYGSKLIKYFFRYKPEGWKAYPAYVQFADGRQLINTAETSIYSKLHMMGYIILRKCFQCPFSNEKRWGDLTLGDYWGVETLISLSNDQIKRGVSLILSHTKKGEELLDLLCQEEQTEGFFVETYGREYLKYQHNLVHPTIKPDLYEEFWKDYEKKSFEDMIRKYLGYGWKYKAIFLMKKLVRRTPLIIWYRNYKNQKMKKKDI